ncbi:MAG: hypothetical protein ACM3VS_17010, partial [Candidatus Dadabacteria bacterium]
MPYYRILIWLKNDLDRKEGIRFIENSNIDAVQNMMRLKVREAFGSKVKDVEVQMLAKGSTAVQVYKEKQKKKRENKKLWGEAKEEPVTFNKAVSRRSEYANREKVPLGERKKGNSN